MNCPQCGAAVVPDASGCPRCAAFLNTAALPAGAATLELTDAQRMWLRTNAVLPLIILAVVLGGMGLIGFCVLRGLAGSLIFKVFIGVGGLLILGVLAATLLHVRNHAADLRAGVAQVASDRLVRRHQSAAGGSGRAFYAEFDQLGRLQVLHTLYEPLVEGRRYRVFYSPRSRRAWTIEPLAAPT